MPPDLTPDDIRRADLGRQFRGYHRGQTEHLLALIAEEHGRVLEQRDALSRQIGDLQREHDDRDTEAKRVAEELSARFQDRDRRAADLGAELKELREARSSELEEAQGLREELSIAQAALEQHRSELIEHREVVARLRTREKALAEQVAMLESQLGEVGEAEVWKPQPEATHLDERAVRALGHLDRVVEVVEREARHDAERMLRKARERADEIIRSAEAERERRLAEEIARHADGEQVREEHSEGYGRTSDRSAIAADASSIGGGHGREPRHLPEYDVRPVWDLPGDLRTSGKDHEDDEGHEDDGRQVPRRLGFGEPTDPGA